MIRTIRRMGIALGSIAAAWLIVGMFGGILLPWLGSTLTVPGPGAPTSSLAGIVATVVLGGLIYRDIIRRESST